LDDNNISNNIHKLLENIAISIYEKDKKLENEEDNAIRKTITLVKEDFTKKDRKKKQGCCWKILTFIKNNLILNY